MLGAGEDRVLRQRLAGLGTALIALTMAEAISPMSMGSSPKVSSTRPQRVSRAMHSTGENVQCTPVEETSSAVARPAASTASGPSSTPCRAGRGRSCAGPEGVAVDAVVADDEWDAETGLGVHGFDGARQVLGAGVQDGATCLFTMSSSRSPPRASSCIIWPTFSSRVMRESRSAMRSEAGRSGFL